MSLALSFAAVAPLYNLAFVAIAVCLFITLFRTPVKSRKAYVKPWIYIFCALMVFLVEEILTVLRAHDIINIPIHINGFFELMIIIFFIYALLLQKEEMD